MAVEGIWAHVSKDLIDSNGVLLVTAGIQADLRETQMHTLDFVEQNSSETHTSIAGGIEPLWSIRLLIDFHCQAWLTPIF